GGTAAGRGLGRAAGGRGGRSRGGGRNLGGPAVRPGDRSAGTRVAGPGTGRACGVRPVRAPHRGGRLVDGPPALRAVGELRGAGGGPHTGPAADRVGLRGLRGVAARTA